MINNKAIDGADIRANILGIDINGFEEIRYGQEQESQNNYGIGRKPRTYSLGRIVYPDGSIVLYEDAVREIEDALPPGRTLTDIPPFPITVSYEDIALKTRIDIVSAKFKNRPGGAGTGEMGIKQTLALHIVDIQWNVKR